MKKLLLILLCFPMIGFGQLQFKLDSIAMGSTSIVQATLIYTYDLQGKCIETFVDYDAWGSQTKMINIYNSNNLIEEIEGYTWDSNNSQWSFTSKQLFAYNANNMIEEVEMIYWDVLTLQWIQNSKWVYYFNSNNQVTIQEAFSWTGSNYELSYKNENTYFSSYIQNLNSDYNNGIWEPQSLGRSYINAVNGSEVDSSFLYLNGNWIYSDRTEYFYNSNLISETAFGWNQPFSVNYPDFHINQPTHQIIYDSNGAPSITYTFYYSPFSGTSSLYENQTTTKQLLKVTDLLGRETKGTKNEVLFYIYDDGTVDKRIVIE